MTRIDLKRHAPREAGQRWNPELHSQASLQMQFGTSNVHSASGGRTHAGKVFTLCPIRDDSCDSWAIISVDSASPAERVVDE